MKTIVTLLYTSLIFIAFSQQQIPNSNFEQWEDISGGLAGQEPINWNSFMTAGGDLTQFAGIQIEASSDKRPGSSGTKSAKIWSRSVLEINANGNVTLG